MKWTKRREGRVKLNMDGCSLGNPDLAGAGEVIRDCSGKMILPYSVSMPPVSNNYAELLGVLEGIKHYKRMGLTKVDIEMDSMVVINWLQQGQCRLWYLEDYWDVTLQGLQELNCSISHIFREGNAPAELLAKLGAQGASNIWTKGSCRRSLEDGFFWTSSVYLICKFLNCAYIYFVSLVDGI